MLLHGENAKKREGRRGEGSDQLLVPMRRVFLLHRRRGKWVFVAIIITYFLYFGNTLTPPLKKGYKYEKSCWIEDYPAAGVCPSVSRQLGPDVVD